MGLVRYKTFNPWEMFPTVLNDYNWQGETEDIAIDVYENDNDVVVKAKAPGFSEKDVRITVVDRNLTIEGEVNSEETEEDNKKKWIKREIRHMSFARSITLPNMVESEKADAHFKDGILTVTLPKAEEAKPKTIEIKAESEVK